MRAFFAIIIVFSRVALQAQTEQVDSAVVNSIFKCNYSLQKFDRYDGVITKSGEHSKIFGQVFFSLGSGRIQVNIFQWYILPNNNYRRWEISISVVD